MNHFEKIDKDNAFENLMDTHRWDFEEWSLKDCFEDVDR